MGYVCIHGTGTPLGDPIEVGALSSALRHDTHVNTGTRPTSVLGSVKACYGHTEGTAGVTGALLSLCMLRQASYPGFMCLRDMNPYVAAALSDWRDSANGVLVPRTSSSSSKHVRFAGTSSFGMSGVNAHAIMGTPVLESLREQPGAARKAIWQRGFVWAGPFLHHLVHPAPCRIYRRS
eukprot:jgi/Botrbrau1/19847/Bobra.0124s0083.1